MWGGPMPHNLETLCLCYADQTCSEVPISSSNRDTVWKGGETTFSLYVASLSKILIIGIFAVYVLSLCIWIMVNSLAMSSNRIFCVICVVFYISGYAFILKSFRLTRFPLRTPCCVFVSDVSVNSLFVCNLYFCCGTVAIQLVCSLVVVLQVFLDKTIIRIYRWLETLLPR